MVIARYVGLFSFNARQANRVAAESELLPAMSGFFLLILPLTLLDFTKLKPSHAGQTVCLEFTYSLSTVFSLMRCSIPNHFNVSVIMRGK